MNTLSSKISVLCIGDELLEGRVSDRNSIYLIHVVRDHNAAVTNVRWVRDELEVIEEALEQACRGADIVVVSGGLGPTSDDVTRDAAAAWSNSELVLDVERLAVLKERFKERGVTFTENNTRQCYFPASATILDSEVGSAHGFLLTREETSVFFFPGVPREFQWFTQRYILPRLPESLTSFGNHFLTMRFYGLGESKLETMLGDITGLAKTLGGRVGYRANYPIIEVTLNCAETAGLEQLRAHVMAKVGPWLISEGEESFAARVGRLLVAANATVTTAESCTAGGISAYITEAAGSSSWFDRGYVTYANAAKVEEVGVQEAVLQSQGAVSSATVCQMALGAKRRAGADYGLAVSGIAGPGGGSDEKPVGTVHFALATPDGVFHRKAWYRGRSREQVRQASVYTALSLLLWHLEGRLDEHRVDGPFSDAQVEDGVLI